MQPESDATTNDDEAANEAAKGAWVWVAIGLAIGFFIVAPIAAWLLGWSL